MSTSQPDCPECEKLLSVSKESNVIGEFLEWLQEDFVIGKWDDTYGGYEREYKSIQTWLAEYFGIDMDKVEQERRALLKWLQEQNK